MRLIDVDELKDRILIDFDMVKMDDTVVIPCIDFKYNIDNAPTVEAIPIEWIKDVWLKREENIGDIETYCPTPTFAVVMNWLIDDWEKENERR